jgi:D-3-phosphoglycerate dehydrogenase / 2-oxoglutarate reductase
VTSGEAPAFTVAVVGVRFEPLDIEAEVLERLSARLVVGAGAQADDIVRVAEYADVVLAGAAPKFTEGVLRRLQRCRAVVRYGIGVDNIDGTAAEALGIAVLNVTDYCTEEVATHTVALILALNRRLFQANEDIRSGSWRSRRLDGIKAVQDETVGIVGAGAIGRCVGAKLLGLGFQCLVYDPYTHVDWASAVEFDQLLESSDYVTLHVPLLATTRHLIDSRAFSLMPPGSAIINTGRGGLIDQEALAAALDSGRLRAAALDVFEVEPQDPASPLVRRGDVIATPHMAWYSLRSEQLLRRRASEQVALVLTGLARERARC